MTSAYIRSPFVREAIADYVSTHTAVPDELQRELRSVTIERTGQYAGMQIGDDQAVFIEMLVRSLKATRAIEVGTFTGYSAIAIARGLGTSGRLMCCDVSEEWTSIAKTYWQRAGLDERIELVLGPALETLRALPNDASVDFAFLDADKTGYLGYYEELISRLRSGGILLADNTLRDGAVVDTNDNDPSTVAIRQFNDFVTSDKRVTSVLLTIGDGLTMIEKR